MIRAPETEASASHHAPHRNVLLSGVVGSTAYGLAGPDSDVDRLGVFAVPTVELHGLGTPRESVCSTGPDVTLHEARKWCSLALGCNPTVMELVWLDGYETCTDLGRELVRIRGSFLSAKRVRDAYLGYATQQFRKMEARGDGSFSADTRKRTAKHARHLLRLCHQGITLYHEGWLMVRLDDPDRYRRFGEDVAAGNTGLARDVLEETERAMNARKTVLPDRPDHATVEKWLRKVRRHYLEDTQ